MDFDSYQKRYGYRTRDLERYLERGLIKGARRIAGGRWFIPEDVRPDYVIRKKASRRFEDDAFDFLKAKTETPDRYDIVVLDPPAFAKNKAAIAAAERGYKEINLRAFQLLRPGGFLISASCSFHISEEHFEEILLSAAVDARRQVQIVERRGAGRDHPVGLGVRETRYLKCLVVRVL